jgi:hypothetical protein
MGANDTAGIKLMGAYAVGLVTLAAVCVMGIAVLTGFKNTGLVDNTTVQYFIVGIGVFGTFAGVIAMALVGKIVIGLFKNGM